MGLGRRQYRAIGVTGPGTVGPTSFVPTFDSVTRLLGGVPYEVQGQSNTWLWKGGMSIPGAYRAATLLANLLAQVDADAYTKHGRDQEELIDPRPLLLEQPAPPDTRLTTFRSQMLDYVWDGNAIGVVAARNAQGMPTGIYPVPAAWVGVRRIENNVQANLTGLQIGTIEYNVSGKTYTSDQIVHVKGPCAPGALRGAGVLEQFLLTTFATAHEQEHQAQTSAAHGVPPGILTIHGDGPTANDPKKMAEKGQMWKQARDTGGVAVMNDQVDFKPLAFDPEKLQMIEGRQFTLLQLANIFGLPPSFLGAPTGNSLNYVTAASEALSLLKFTMQPHFTQFEQTYSLLFPRGTVVRFDLDAFLRSDTLQRYMAYQIGRDTGFLLNSEIRTKEKLPPVAGIDNAPTAIVQKQLNKGLPIDEPGLKQITEGDLNGVPGLTKATPPIQAAAQRLPTPALLAGQRASQLEFGHGSALWRYWVGPEGFARYAASPTPWETLRDALLSEGVPAGKAEGLTTNIMQATPAGRALFAAHHQGGGH